MVVFCARIRKTGDINGVVGTAAAFRAASAAGRGLGRAGVAGIAGLIGFKFIFVFIDCVALVDRLKQRTRPRSGVLIEPQIIHELVFIERLKDNAEDSLRTGGFQPCRVLEIGDQK